MTDKFEHLPWDDLRRLEGDLPWSALETFAEAVVSESEVSKNLIADYERAWQAGPEVPTYLDLYVPAIFALAALKLDERQRYEIGSFLVDKLIEAGREQAELTEEALLAAAGAMGPVILPKVLDTLEATKIESREESVAWSMCWNLTALAVKTEDTAIRTRTVQACVRVLQQIEQGAVEAWLGISAAWTLALLRYTDAAPLIQRLSEEYSMLDGGGDYEEAAEFLQGRWDRAPYKETWEEPVRNRLEWSWQMARKWYERDHTAGSMKEFDHAPEAQERRAYGASDQASITPPIPIVEHSPKIGRNDPCPCGSGKKYKKCCGNPAKDQTSSV